MTTVISSHRRLVFSAALAGLATLASLLALGPPAAAAEIDQQKQYCISRGGTNGDASYVGSCNFSDYQQCLQAAAASRGNCVGNIDWHGDAAPVVSTRRTRRPH